MIWWGSGREDKYPLGDNFIFNEWLSFKFSLNVPQYETLK
jgi:hypothetical protein